MKQRVVVQAILKHEGKVILLRRSQGKQNLIGKYELPGGTINSGEQPDDALRRHIKNSTGLDIDHDGLSLRDVLSVSSREEGDIQHIFISYLYTKPIDLNSIKLGISYDDYIGFDVASGGDSSQLRDSAKWLLGISQAEVRGLDNSSNDVKNTTTGPVNIIYSDGGSRGNPGPSASAFVILGPSHDVIDQGGEYLGYATSNQAEYMGVLLGLQRARDIGIKNIEFRIDSMLVVNQLKGLYTIKNKELVPINEKIKGLLGSFSRVRFNHVPRELNRQADHLVNKILDENRDY